MRHEQAGAFRRFDAIDAAVIWPSAADLAPAPICELERSAPAAPDLPVAIGRMLAGSYAALIAVCLLTLGGSREAMFAIVVSGLYVLIYCAVPLIFLRVEADPCPRPTLRAFLRGGIDTATGHLSGRAALVQMLVVPVMLTFCLLAIGTMAGLYLPA
jgi:hypothetical protein